MHPHIAPYQDDLRPQILTVWERSVLATHDFLSAEDFKSIREIVHTIDFNQFDVFCLLLNNTVIGFLGVADGKIEMLFIEPAYFRQRYGRLLVNYAVNELSADKVDVNEQNSNAVKFYQCLGFEAYERTSKDDQGKDYPLLRMRMKR